MVSERHPLKDGFRRARLLSNFFDFPYRVGDQEGWAGARSLFTDDDERLRDLVMTYGRERWGTDDCHVAGSAFLIAYLTRLIWPVAAQFALERKLPDVRLANLAFHWRQQRIDGTALSSLRFAALAGTSAGTHPDALAVADEAELYALLKEWLFKENLDLVIPSLRRAAKASTRVSWNAVGAAFSQAFNRLYAVSNNPDEVVNDAAVIFGDPASPIYGEVAMEVFSHRGNRGFFSRRRGCCLWWRTGRANDYCSNCILLTREEQDERFRRSFQAR